ncbi:alpha/beta hydrolase [Gordonia sp. SL306]|uniref:alpha/beta hydrolase n=1 Tax=Gordonia sp. SL306 TaxID=2995145 RepID=UPI00226D6ADC|nr:alpha/beta hydrolase-fold protein [Gordonia sp. SL306]WAC54631.1 alpha/beta hydrolase-fold protein [Gordonia sp. SL306]
MTVTFGARTTADVRRVLLVGNGLIERDRPADGLFNLVGDGIWQLALRVPVDHRGSYQVAFDMDATPGPLPELAGRAVADPLNAARIPVRWSAGEASVLELPDAPPSRWRPVSPDTPRGTVTTLRWAGSAAVSARDVHVYRSAGTREATGVVVLSDGDMWFGRIDLAGQLDAMVAAGEIPPITVVAPSAVDIDTRWHDLTAQDTYADFLAAEIRSFATESGPVSNEPRDWTIAGQSLGGLTALHTAVRHQEVFGGVLAQSPSLWWRPGSEYRVRLDTQGMWLLDHLVNASADQRFRIDVGRSEGRMVDLARAAAAALADRGADVTLTEYSGGHDHACWRVHLLDGIKELHS